MRNSEQIKLGSLPLEGVWKATVSPGPVGVGPSERLGAGANSILMEVTRLHALAGQGY